MARVLRGRSKLMKPELAGFAAAHFRSRSAARFGSGFGCAAAAGVARLARRLAPTFAAAPRFRSGSGSGVGSGTCIRSRRAMRRAAALALQLLLDFKAPFWSASCGLVHSVSLPGLRRRVPAWSVGGVRVLYQALTTRRVRGVVIGAVEPRPSRPVLAMKSSWGSRRAHGASRIRMSFGDLGPPSARGRPGGSARSRVSRCERLVE